MPIWSIGCFENPSDPASVTPPSVHDLAFLGPDADTLATTTADNPQRSTPLRPLALQLVDATEQSRQVLVHVMPS